ncbi:hypothetical protein HMPREF0530_1466 [Lacticaseibacillus paracasei subsp. paracasei ATCC 25302 = DSM 5622 = JCM 8130]|nr:hypothetical protein HMPREF0530_1466 [Lacticaseibacillus paracasei subsp. paracasei ATCC 25302 = DSM 5622 = JCM 8130]KRM64109.1 hypothetical protein FC74_GL002046 [Lacticaseibacillus paracasei subsp. paracasei ATCC 25302 = DSM 5622 = JCM 8130]
MPFGLYMWEARSMLEGSFLRDVDMRRDLMELAVNIANIQNAKNPKRSVKTGYKNIDKAEQKILKRNGNRERKPDVEMIKKLNAIFGGDS